jgi:ammonium transporter, Amt family
MNLVPGLSLRVTAEEEEMGVDDAELGEFAYDYVELRREASDILPTATAAGSTHSLKSHQPEKTA